MRALGRKKQIGNAQPKSNARSSKTEKKTHSGQSIYQQCILPNLVIFLFIWNMLETVYIRLQQHKGSLAGSENFLASHSTIKTIIG